MAIRLQTLKDKYKRFSSLAELKEYAKDKGIVREIKRFVYVIDKPVKIKEKTAKEIEKEKAIEKAEKLENKKAKIRARILRDIEEKENRDLEQKIEAEILAEIKAKK